MQDKDLVNFEDTDTAFSYKSTRDLKLGLWLFRVMSRGFWSDALSSLGGWALKFHLPFARYLIRETVYEQFIGGDDLEECVPVINTLREHQCLVVLDYSVEGKHDESDLDETRDQFLRTIEFAANQPSVPVASLKITGIAQNRTLQAWGEPSRRKKEFEERWDRVEQRLTSICECAAEYGKRIFIDAEESWYQDAIDFLADKMMMQFNQDHIVVYNTYQLYRHDRLDFLKQSYETSREEGYILGAKLVRGAYMEKERERARRKKYPSPISPDKDAVDQDYNDAVVFCAQNYKHIAMCAATHNLISCKLLADYIAELPARRNHPHLNFCQLYGMGDDITFNLAAHGYNVAKYLPYGPVREVFPYLVRRAEENKAMSNEFSREYQLIKTELERRRDS